ncbi:MAG: hypothetical protein KKD39_06255 [Candidatus Altiarchaeota archaeon]|nr:hypothetical protein [Candidatus Altiarchaeota archaeon]
MATMYCVYVPAAVTDDGAYTLPPNFDATVDKNGRIHVSYGQMENSIVHDKRHFMELVQRQREYLNKKPNTQMTD